MFKTLTLNSLNIKTNTFKAETEEVKTNKGCLNSCCAVCIPGKNCEVLKP